MLKSLYPLAQMFARPLWWAISPPARGVGSRGVGERRRVLLVYYNKLTARYVQHVAEILRDDPRVELVVTRAPFVDRESKVDDFEHGQRPIPHMPFMHTLAQWWDMVVFADHYPAAMFHPAIPKIFVTHGIFAGRRFGDVNYVYGRRAVHADGSPVFTKMLAAGQLERQCVREVNPKLLNRVAVTGDVVADELVLRQPRRSQIRDQLSMRPDEKVVLLMSSWGPDSLIQKHGAELFRELASLSHEYRLVLSIHPNNWTRRAESDNSWIDAVKQCDEFGVTLVSGIDWQDYVVAADMFVADFTSLSLYASLMKRPIVMTSIDEGQFTPGSPVVGLAKLVTRCDDISRLSEAIENASADAAASCTERTQFADDLVSHLGSSVSRIAEETYRILNLEPWPFFGRCCVETNSREAAAAELKDLAGAGTSC